MTLLSDNDPILLKVSESLSKDEIKSSETKKLAQDLFDIMVKNEGMGISAVQVGILKRIFIVHVPGFSQACINPKILMYSKKKWDFSEGCLSFPEKIIKINRSEAIQVSYVDINGKLVYTTLHGMAARVFIHEFDHLRGVVFTSYDTSLSST